ncbi:MAG: hypothetical protein JWM82_3846, partial [Myxococcales bacterium]|nr:hypothetical protein [Myxococcales bacterium]
FFAPLHAPLHVAAPGVYYLGHVDAAVREGVGNELKAGVSVPLIDQSIAGASGGTFDVAISDQWTIDEPLFRNAFPGLDGVPIQKMILPPFNRAVAQKWWQDN